MWFKFEHRGYRGQVHQTAKYHSSKKILIPSHIITCLTLVITGNIVVRSQCAHRVEPAWISLFTIELPNKKTIPYTAISALYNIVWRGCVPESARWVRAAERPESIEAEATQNKPNWYSVVTPLLSLSFEVEFGLEGDIFSTTAD